jgi:hypothetical protein
MEGCGKTIGDPTVYTSEGKAKPSHGAVMCCGLPYPSQSFPDWVFFCQSCAVKAGVIW